MDVENNISQFEYQTLAQDNIMLQLKICQMTSEKISYDLKSNNGKSTNSLKKENKLINDKLDQLKDTFKQHQQNICKLEDENIQLRKEIDILKNENVTLKIEIESLKKQNISLSNENKILQQNVILLLDDNNSIAEQMEKLTQENELLKREIEFLKRENELLRNENDSLKLKIVEMDKKIDYLNNEISTMKINKLYKKYITAIQDINRKEQMEKILRQPEKQILIKLKRDRNDYNHYIDENFDTQFELDIKMIVLIDRLNNMPQYVSTKFNKKYPGLLSELNKCLIRPNIIPSQDELDDANEWWNE